MSTAAIFVFSFKDCVCLTDVVRVVESDGFGWKVWKFTELSAITDNITGVQERVHLLLHNTYYCCWYTCLCYPYVCYIRKSYSWSSLYHSKIEHGSLTLSEGLNFTFLGEVWKFTELSTTLGSITCVNGSFTFE